MNRQEETRHFDYNRNVIERTMVAKLTVTEYSGKINASIGQTE
ncbi:hypothetical protein [Anaerosporobacter faecicola]|nr:hypothetical protein [Anaerosporobacter faecicola]